MHTYRRSRCVSMQEISMLHAWGCWDLELCAMRRELMRAHTLHMQKLLRVEALACARKTWAAVLDLTDHRFEPAYPGIPNAFSRSWRNHPQSWTFMLLPILLAFWLLPWLETPATKIAFRKSKASDCKGQQTYRGQSEFEWAQQRCFCIGCKKHVIKLLYFSYFFMLTHIWFAIFRLSNVSQKRWR